VVTRFGDVGYLRRQVSTVDVVGTSPEYLPISGYQLEQGRFFTDIEEVSTKKVVVLGADVAGQLFPAGMDPLGATVLVHGRPFQVVGTLGRKGEFLGYNQDLRVIIPFRVHRSILGHRRGVSITLAVEDPERVAEAEDQLVGILRRARGTPAEKEDDFSIQKPEQLMETYQKLTGALYGVATGIGFITLLVGGIGIMNIMLVSVRERTREIGVRRALGARKRTIVVQFLLEAVAVSAVGGALGTMVGLGAAKLVSLITPLTAAVEVGTIFFGISFAAGVGLIFGIWPAARAANLDPVEALRHE
jgi:putative ABC transport system permease protein